MAAILPPKSPGRRGITVASWHGRGHLGHIHYLEQDIIGEHEFRNLADFGILGAESVARRQWWS